MNTCSICNTTPATIDLHSVDVDKYCAPCRYKRAMVRAIPKRKASNFYYPCS